MSALLKYVGVLLAAVTTVLLTVLITATNAFAKQPTPGHSGGSVDQPAMSPVIGVAETGVNAWYIVAIAVGAALVAATGALAVAHYRTQHRAHHGLAA